MKRRMALRIAAGAVISIMTIAAANTPWHAAVDVQDRGYVIGNPDAEHTLISFASYSCPHCAKFAVEGEPALQLAYVATGKLRYEIRPILRNVIDLTATMLVQCGAPEKFPRNHSAMMLTQDKWLETLNNASSGQVQRWTAPNHAAARRAIASDLGFYDMMEARGYRRPEIDRCLADNDRATQLQANSKADLEEFNLQGTPSFAIDGKTLENVHNWSALEHVLIDLYYAGPAPS